jgi:2-polyprenyl-6-methoxyphenol hydroxylase-like FAD-dependent oxidoreductase
LFTDGTGSRVTGVRLRDRRLNAGAPLREVYGSLIVDASGRGSQLPDWLAEIGRRNVREDFIDAGMTYASRFYAVPAAALRGWRAAYVQAALPKAPRGGILFPIEHDRWHLTLFGYANAAPPTDERGFRAFGDALRSPILADILRHATPLTQIVSHRRTANCWRRFDEIADWPDGLIAVGDALCCFDPVYGQGMTTGILSALEMKAQLDAEWRDASTVPRGYARRVQRRMLRAIEPAWNFATSEDLRLVSTVGRKLGRRERLLQRYLDSVVATSTADTFVRGRLLSVMNMLTGPETLMRPSVVWRVIRHLCGSNARPEPLWAEAGAGQELAMEALVRQAS